MKFKKVCACVLAASMVMSLAACGSAAEETAPAAETTAAAAEDTADEAAAETPAAETTAAADESGYPDYSGVTIRFAWWGSQPRHDATIKVIEQYEALTGLNIEYEYYDFSGYFTQLDTLVAADDVWDVFQMGNNWATYYDAIEPLNEYIDGGAIDTSNINAPLMQVTQDYDGNQMGISLGTNCRCIAYNPALFEEAGVPEPTDNWTWDDFANACLQIHEKTGAYGMDKLEYFTLLGSYCTQMGEGYNFFSMDGSDFSFNDDTSAIAQMFDTFAELEAAGAVADPGVQAEIVDEQADYICTGESAMLLIPSNKFVALNEAVQDGIELKLALLPRLYADGQSGMLVRSSQMLCMSAASEQKEAAASFMDYMINSTEANEILNGERGVPINTTVREDLASKSDEITAEVYEFIDKVSSIEDTANTTNAEPDAQTELSQVLQQYFEAMFAGDYASGQECADAFYEEAKTIFASYQ
ncbi:MAG: extracellular solute-binding protein [Lachnospiraceae bacterium]|nr:extracellular solute-binding protein [Lachnospiraceae bacterium]